MTKVIIIPEENLDRHYERTVKHLRTKYHSRPSFLSNSSSNGRQSNLDTPHSNYNYSQSRIPLGKLVG